MTLALTSRRSPNHHLAFHLLFNQEPLKLIHHFSTPPCREWKGEPLPLMRLLTGDWVFRDRYFLTPSFKNVKVLQIPEDSKWCKIAASIPIIGLIIQGYYEESLNEKIFCSNDQADKLRLIAVKRDYKKVGIVRDLLTLPLAVHYLSIAVLYLMAAVARELLPLRFQHFTLRRDGRRL